MVRAEETEGAFHLRELTGHTGCLEGLTLQCLQIDTLKGQGWHSRLVEGFNGGGLFDG